MQQVAKQVAVAVDNVLHDESAQSAQRQLTRERDRLQLLLEVNNAVVSHLGPGRRVRGRQRVPARASSSTTAPACCSTSRTRGQYRCHVLRLPAASSFMEEGRADRHR